MLTKIPFLQHALPEAATAAIFALGTGLVGLALAVILCAAYVRDRVALWRSKQKRSNFQPPRLGPLSLSVGAFLNDPAGYAPFSPDSAAEFVAARLDYQHELYRISVRFLTYAPLLVGLSGTILALRSLLVDSGKTLQDIQPSLAGVFAGTLGGIIGSLLAGVGGVALDWAARTTNDAAQDWVHTHVLPLIPERRIGVKIEEAVLAIVTERAQCAADAVAASMWPVAHALTTAAERCAEAAQTASHSFAEVTRAVREAGDIEVATRNFKAGAHMLDSSAETLSDATRQTAEVILRLGELRGGVANQFERLQELGGIIAAASERAAGQMGSATGELARRIGEAGEGTSTLRGAVVELAAAVNSRAELDSSRIGEIRSQAAETTLALKVLENIAKETQTTLAGLPVGVGEFNKGAFEALRSELSIRIEPLVDTIVSTLRSVGPALEGSAEKVRDAAERANSDLSNTCSSMSILAREVRSVVQEVERLTRSTQRPDGSATAGPQADANDGDNHNTGSKKWRVWPFGARS